MNLPNSLFEDFPIEFKEINPEDFLSFEVENNREKIIIEPNSDGFINDTFQDKISLTHKNTVVVNAAVGQGKSTAIINTIGKYYRNYPNTIIIVASPFVSLVEQYCNDINIKAEIPEEQIYNYGSIGRDFSIDYRQRRVHVITVNTLLGNPGEDSLKNSYEKKIYLNSLSKYCNDNGLKVVFVYDEIHDAIQNFKEEYIFSLWKWRGVILKNYILSATYNEASKIVIEYLAELTDKKIQIIESKRIVFPEKQSKLFLHFSPANRFKSTNPELVKIIQDLITRNKKIDILSFSKKLANGIIDDEEGIGKLLKDKYGELNDCTSELLFNQRPENAPPTNRYDNTKCNIGTNFKTGVSIEKDNHAFVIIMPGRSTRMEFTNQYGIFSGGINSIIQALARQRRKGEIHILLPHPDKFNYRSLSGANMTESQIEGFKEFYESISYDGNINTGTVNYFTLNAQDKLISKFYNEELHGFVSDEVNFVNSLDRETLAPLRYPNYKLFKLNSGEDVLASQYEFFGKDIAAYLTYSALTNQFINCRLENVAYKPDLYFNEGEIQSRLYFFYKEYFDEYEQLKRQITFNYFYNSLRDELFNSFTLKLKSASGVEVIKPYNKEFEKALMFFCAKQYFGRNFFYYNRITSNTLDFEYTRDLYFFDCMAIAQTINVEELNYSQEHKNKIRAYQNLDIIREIIISKARSKTRGSTYYEYVPVKPQGIFSQEEIDLLIETASLLIEVDDLIKNDVFNFRRNLYNSDGSLKSTEKQMESLYKMFVSDFFTIPELNNNYPIITIDGERIKVKSIVHIKELPDAHNVVDTLRIDPLILFANEYYGSVQNMNAEINAALAQSDS